MLSFLRSQYRAIPTPTQNLTGRTCLVTGASSGLGLQTTLQLCAHNPARITLAVRNKARGELAARLVREVATSYAGELVVWELDLADFASVQRFIDEDEHELDRLDCLVLNAGEAAEDWTMTSDRWESMLQVNALANGLLALLLLPHLARTAQLPMPGGGAPFRPHVTLVGSDSRAWSSISPASLSLTTLNSARSAVFSPSLQFASTKCLAHHLITRLSTLPLASSITFTTVNPTHTSSTISRYLATPFSLFLNTFLARSAEDSAKGIVWAAVRNGELAKVVEAGVFLDVGDDGAEWDEVWSECLEVWRGVDRATVDAALR